MSDIDRHQQTGWLQYWYIRVACLRKSTVRTIPSVFQITLVTYYSLTLEFCEGQLIGTIVESMLFVAVVEDGCEGMVEFDWGTTSEIWAPVNCEPEREEASLS